MSIGHQYLLLSEHFESIPEKAIDRFLLNLNTKITAIGSRKLLGLSFRSMPNDEKRNIITVPPLLRQEVKSIQPQAGERWLAYLTHFRLADEIMAWSKDHPEVQLDCFWDNPTRKSVYQYSDSLTFHPIDAVKYLEKMTHCAGLISTAGFESVAEAMYLGKPVMMVPVPNHIEQMINAHDGELSGAGVQARTFDLNIFNAYLPTHEPVQEQFQHWVAQANFAYQLTDLIRKPLAKPKFNPSNEGGLSTSW
jgi:uncharacterized protein (TIGR00661 family)